jgi:hypothetical protein
VNRFVIQPDPHPARANAVTAVLRAEVGTRVDIAPATQTDIQRDKYHAMIGDIAKHEAHFTAEVWKRLLIDQFKADTLNDAHPRLKAFWLREKIEMLPSLDRQRVVILGEQSRNFPKFVASAFVEWLYAWGADKDIRWSEPREGVE